jgi:hypothetical protein
MIVVADLHQLTQTTGDTYMVDASDLGLAPGTIPNHVVVELDRRRVMVFTRSHSLTYRTPEGVTLTIWND